MRQIGVSEDTAVVVEWLVEAGEEVRRGTEIAVVETSKATVELEADGDGFLYPAVPQGTEVPVQAPVALILDDRDDREAERLIAELGAPAEPREGASPVGRQ